MITAQLALASIRRGTIQACHYPDACDVAIYSMSAQNVRF